MRCTLKKRAISTFLQMLRRTAATYRLQNTRQGTAHHSICRKTQDKTVCQGAAHRSICRKTQDKTVRQDAAHRSIYNHFGKLTTSAR